MFSFDACQNIRITSCLINTPDAASCAYFESCEDICINFVSFNGLCDSAVFTGECKNISVKNCNVTVIQDAKESNISGNNLELTLSAGNSALVVFE